MGYVGATPLGTIGAAGTLCENLHEGSTFPSTLPLRPIAGASIPAVASWGLVEAVTGERFYAPATAANATQIAGLGTLGIPHGTYRVWARDGGNAPIVGLGGWVLFHPTATRLPTPTGDLAQFAAATAMGFPRFRSGAELHWENDPTAPIGVLIDLGSAAPTAHPSRARKLIASLAEGVNPASPSEIAQATQWATDNPEITEWLLGNEPSVDAAGGRIPIDGPGMVAWMRAAAQAVWAGNPAARCYGPNPVFPMGTQAAWYRAAVAAGLYDTWSGSGGRRILPASHLYSYVDLPSLGITLDTLAGIAGADAVAASYRDDEWDAHKAMDNGAGNAAKQLAWCMSGLAKLESRGVPISHLHLFPGAFPAHSSLVHSFARQPFPVLGAIRRMSDEIIDCDTPETLATGTPLDAHTVITRYRRDGNSTVLLVSDGMQNADGTPLVQRFAVTGSSIPTSLTRRNYAGRALTPAAITGGTVTLEVPVGGPCYVDVPDGVTLEPRVETWTSRNTGATAGMTEWNGTAYVSTSLGMANVPARQPLDSYRSGRMFDVTNGTAGDRSALLSNVTPTPTHPVTYWLTFPTSRFANAFPLSSLMPHEGDQAAILEATFEGRVGGTWVPLTIDGDPLGINITPDVLIAPATLEEGDGGHYEWLRPPAFAWPNRFDRVWLDGVRVIVKRVTAAGAPEVAAIDGYGAGDVSPGSSTPRATIARIGLYDVADAPISTGGGYLVAAP